MALCLQCVQLSTHNVIQITRSLFNGRKPEYLSDLPSFLPNSQSWPSPVMAITADPLNDPRKTAAAAPLSDTILAQKKTAAPKEQRFFSSDRVKA